MLYWSDACLTSTNCIKASSSQIILAVLNSVCSDRCLASPTESLHVQQMTGLPKLDLIASEQLGRVLIVCMNCAKRPAGLPIQDLAACLGGPPTQRKGLQCCGGFHQCRRASLGDCWACLTLQHGVLRAVSHLSDCGSTLCCGSTSCFGS